MVLPFFFRFSRHLLVVHVVWNCTAATLIESIEMLWLYCNILQKPHCPGESARLHMETYVFSGSDGGDRRVSRAYMNESFSRKFFKKKDQFS